MNRYLLAECPFSPPWTIVPTSGVLAQFLTAANGRLEVGELHKALMVIVWQLKQAGNKFMKSVALCRCHMLRTRSLMLFYLSA